MPRLDRHKGEVPVTIQTSLPRGQPKPKPETGLDAARPRPLSPLAITPKPAEGYPTAQEKSTESILTKGIKSQYVQEDGIHQGFTVFDP